MTSPRRNLFEPGQAGAYHCVSRCVRRAWLCGIDSYTGESFEHRKPIVEARIQKLGEIFAVGIHTYAVMSNHVHVVLSVAARAVYQWPDEEVARRWLTLYPPKPIDYPARHAELCADPVRPTVLRERLADLSWFMKSLSEPIGLFGADGVWGRWVKGVEMVCKFRKSDSFVITSRLFRWDSVLDVNDACPDRSCPAVSLLA